MKKYLLQTLDINDYSILPDEVNGGTRPRILLKNTKNNHKFFVKSYAKSPREVWVEVFASILGSKIEGFIQVQQARLKKIPNSLLKVLEKTSTNKGLQPLVTCSDYVFPVGFDIKYGHRIVGKNPRDNVSMKEVYDSISKSYGFTGAHEKLLQNYADMIVFDALIGNMDRHLENWGILEHEKFRSSQMVMDPKEVLSESFKFTPLFDNGSAGLFELSEDQVLKYLKDLPLFKKTYILGNTYSLITADSGEPMNIFNTIGYQMNNPDWKKYLKKSIRAIGKLTLLDMAEVIFKMPEDRVGENEYREAIEYSRERKELLLRSLYFRHQILTDLI